MTCGAFEAVVATLPLGSVGFERGVDESRLVPIWVEAAVTNKLTALRGPGETISDVIVQDREDADQPLLIAPAPR